MVEVMWCDKLCRAGIEFRALAEDMQEMMSRWVFSRARAQQLLLTEPIPSFEDEFEPEETMAPSNVDEPSPLPMASDWAGMLTLPCPESVPICSLKLLKSSSPDALTVTAPDVLGARQHSPGVPGWSELDLIAA